MAIVKAGLADLDQCVDILFIPEIGKLYYPRKELLRAEMEKRIVTDAIFIEKTMRGGVIPEPDIQGIIWYQREGLFSSFPYLHMIAVKDGCRHQGLGGRLMDFFEQDSLCSGKNRIRTKAFLLVSDRNSSAQKFYQDRGYQEMARLESLFRKGVTEILLMKKVTEIR